MGNQCKIYITAVLAILALAGCRNDANEPDTSIRMDAPVFMASIGDLHSRAFDSQWEANDEIGISGAGRTNVCYVTADENGRFTVKTIGDQIYFQNDNEEIFTAYWPWKAEAGTSSSININTKNQAQQKSFDFLYARATGQKSQPNVALNFTHKMAKLLLTLKPGAGMSYDELKGAALSLRDIKHTGSFNITYGTTTVGEESEIWTFSDFAHFDDAESIVTFSLILFPQAFNVLEFIAELTSSDGNLLSLKANLDFTTANRKIDGEDAKNEWAAGRQYNLSLTLNKTEISVNDCMINPWNDVKGDEIVVD